MDDDSDVYDDCFALRAHGSRAHSGQLRASVRHTQVSLLSRFNAGSLEYSP